MIDLSFKYGLVKQRGAQKVKQIRGCMSGKEEDRVAALEEWMRAIKAKHTSGRKISCKSCTHPTHEPGQCPGKKVKFFFFFFFFNVDKQDNSKFQQYVQIIEENKQKSTR